MDQASIGLGGGMVACLASLFRFWTVAVNRNSSRAPARLLRLSLTTERTFLASPKSLNHILVIERKE